MKIKKDSELSFVAEIADISLTKNAIISETRFNQNFNDIWVKKRLRSYTRN